ncbi:MAG: hypothetical protein M1820_010435 [Bogoriella megaspora]|nr:MAG: hypothetical protein M1820_010435 [Bogoriella megaspora]
MAMVSRSSPSAQTGSHLPTDISPNTPISLASSPRAIGGGIKENPNLLQSHASDLATNSIARFSKSPQPTSSKRKLSLGSSPPALTGAAAMADEKRLKESEKQQSSQTSSNPASRIIEVLRSGAGMSKPSDAPPETTATNEAVAQAASKIAIPETNVISDQNTTSPVSMTSIGTLDSTTGAPAMTATVTDTSAGGASGVEEPSVTTLEGIARSRTPSDALAPPSAGSARAFTYPGPLGNADPEGPHVAGGRSGGSLPAPSYGQNSPKSPGHKRHKCPYCSTDFTRHHNLKSHLLTHSQEKPYVCQTCQSRFRRLHDLKRHTKLHTGERPHTCSKCGRRFARGDALARHNKGQGGCAGRRASFGADEDYGEGRDDSMDGLMYHNDGADDRMDDDEEMPDARRQSEPSSKRTHRQDSGQGPYHTHSSTYPPPAVQLRSNVHGMQPPSTHQGSYVTSPRDSTAVSPKAGSSSILPFASQNSGMISYGMTESPKPLSPGNDPHRLSVGDANHAHRNRSPSLNQQIHQQQLNRGAGRGTPPMGYSASQSHPHPPQLPSLPGLAPSGRSTDSRGPAPSILHQQLPQPTAGSGSNPGSLSSHGQSSGGSMREILSGGPGGAQGAGQQEPLWSYVRDLESRMQRMHDEYELRISRMQEEIISLRNGAAQHR